MFPKVPQSSLGILKVPQLPPPLEHPPQEPYKYSTTSKLQPHQVQSPRMGLKIADMKQHENDGKNSRPRPKLEFRTGFLL